MRYALLNLLACPMCKYFPLKLYVFEKSIINKEFDVATPFCDVYCGLKAEFLDKLDKSSLNCSECVKVDIISGIIVCPRCDRWYPIIDGIPWMYPDNMRRHQRIRSKEVDFIKKYREKIPDELLNIISRYLEK